VESAYPAGRARTGKEFPAQKLAQTIGAGTSASAGSRKNTGDLSKLPQFGEAARSAQGESCPAPPVWAELATGLMPQDAALKLLEHAGACRACAEELQNAIYAVGNDAPVNEEIGRQLATATEEWQRNFAASLASGLASEIVSEKDLEKDVKRDPSSPEQPTEPGAAPAGVRKLLARPWVIAAAAGLVAGTVAMFSWLRRRRLRNGE
jgi:hypothetical protein